MSNQAAIACLGKPPDTQADERAAWAKTVRSMQGQRNHRTWRPQLDPLPVLSRFCQVLVSPRQPLSIGTVARACSAFELEDLRIVAPRSIKVTRSAQAQPLQERTAHSHTKSALNTSKGAQYLVWQSRIYDDLQAALEGCSYSVAFARWTKGRRNAYPDLVSLLEQEPLEALLSQAADMGRDQAGTHAGHAPVEAAGQPVAADPRLGRLEAAQVSEGGQAAARIALVFGREVDGLMEEELDAVAANCAIPIGRLQESLSVSHAASVVLSQLFQHRLSRLCSLGDSAYQDLLSCEQHLLDNVGRER